MEKINPLKIYEDDKTAIVNLSDGKIPPQAIDLEEAVLGAMLIDEKGVNEIIEILSPEVFYKKSHQLIYESIERLFRESEPIDLLTVSADLKKNKNFESVGGDFYLINLSQKVSSSAHIEFHSRIILQKYIQRKLITISNEIIQKSYDETSDVMDLLDEAESKLYDVAQGNLRGTSETAQTLVLKAKKRIEEIEKREGALSGISTGFEKLDRLTSGWQPSDLVIVAARPGMGKTALALSMARNISVKQNIPVAFFSLEMSSVQLITRLISSETGLVSDKLRTGKLAEHEWQQLNIKVSDLESAPLYIDDSPSLTIFELRAKARRLASSHGIKLIIIDYLQLMSGSNNVKDGRVQEISEITRGLKAIAKELNIPIIALSQLSRQVEQRDDKRPLLSDLRESGTIEQDADVVMFIFRESYYLERLEPIRKPDEDEMKYQTRFQRWRELSEKSHNIAELIIAKQRHGPIGTIKTQFDANVTKFNNLAKENYDITE